MFAVKQAWRIIIVSVLQNFRHMIYSNTRDEQCEFGHDVRALRLDANITLDHEKQEGRTYG